MNCEECMNFYYDEEYEEYMCAIDFDEDETARFLNGSVKACPYYRRGDDYTIVRKQN